MQQAIAPGTVIDKRYQIQNKLADTTSNQCYLAEDADQSNRLVIVSFPKLELQTIPGFTSAFDGACKHLIKARLSGLVKVLNHGEYDSQPYAVVQYVTHETLATSFASIKNKQQKTSIDEVLDWARPLAVTLDELHGLGYIHSNVRPTTIFLGQQRQILLGDFVTEYAVQQLGAFKQAISSLDIPDYLAPEYIKSHYDKSYDQYLLATIVYEVLAGRSHFHNPGSSEAYRRQVATKFPEPLLTQRPELVGASRILSKALERNPAKRFDTCRDFVNQLGSTQASHVSDDKPVTVIRKVLDLDETGPAEPIITSSRSSRGSGSKKGLIWLGILLLGTGVGAYTVNHFGGLDPLKTQLSGLFSNQSNTTEAPVVLPVDIAVNDQKAVGDLNKTPTPVTGEATPDSQNSLRVDAAVEQKNTQATLADKPVLPEPVAASNAEVGEKQIVDSESATTNTPSSVADVGDDAIKQVINQALAEGEAEFNKSKPEAGSNANPADVTQINEAISAALQEAEVDFMRKSSPAASTNNAEVESSGNDKPLSSDENVAEVATETTAGNSPVNAEEVSVTANDEGEEKEVVADEPAEQQEVIEQAGVGTENNAPLNASEIASQDLQDQMIAASKLADEQVARSQQRNAQKSSSDDKSEAETAANKVASEPATKTLADMQKERARIRAIKAQKTARINSITKDCTLSGKIHRQALAGNLSYVKNCLSVGVSPNLTQSNRWTLLHLASQGGYLNMAKLLIAKGADVNAKASDGKTPLDMANEKKQERMIDYLRKRGGATTR